ncbi:MAG TPA: hypothetical protein VFE51_17250 [Verrucomicrobiae bacterium]|nr:hypothetical protein [Verrucomicrobiae bacterium]
MHLPAAAMKVVPFVCHDLETALQRIHTELGPDAIVLSVRPLPRQGLSRFWTRTRSIEVLACIPSMADQTLNPAARISPNTAASAALRLFSASRRVSSPLQDGSARPHVLVGPPGVGKTTLLCKWMTRSVLQENRVTKVWRLDAGNANTAEFLNVYTEMLGVALERFWNSNAGNDQAPGDPGVDARELLLIDLPGVPSGDAQAMRNLKAVLASLPRPRVHLILNAAYESSTLFEQFRAFASFEPEDLGLCHLDEDCREDKLLDFLKGTNCCLRFLSTGQKVPGDILVADAIPGLWAQMAA